MELPADIDTPTSDFQPLVLNPQPLPADYLWQPLPPRTELVANNQTIVKLGNKLSEAGIDITTVLSRKSIRSYIAIAEAPYSDDHTFSKKRDVSPRSVGKIRARLLDSLYEVAEAHGHSGVSTAPVDRLACNRPATYATLTAEDETVGIVREYGNSVDAIRALHTVLSGCDVDYRDILPRRTASLYADIVASDKPLLSEVAQQMGISPSALAKSCERILKKLSPCIPAGAKLPPILLSPVKRQRLHRPRDIDEERDFIDGALILPAREQLKASNHNILTLARRLAQSGVDIRETLPPGMIQTYDIIVEHPKDTNRQFSEQRGVVFTSVSYMKRYLLDRLFEIYKTYQTLPAYDGQLSTPSQQSELLWYTDLVRTTPAYAINHRYGTALDALRTVAKVLKDYDVEPGLLLTPYLARWYSEANDSNESITELAERFAYDPSIVHDICSRIISHIHKHLPEDADLPPILKPPQNVTHEIGELLVGRLVAGFAKYKELDAEVLQRFVRGDATISPALLEVLMPALAIPPDQADELRQRYKDEHIQATKITSAKKRR